MAPENRPATDHLSFLAAAEAKARRFGIFPLLRMAEARARLPRIGRSRLPSQNVADLGHTPGMDFPGPTVDSISLGRKGRFRIRSRFLGLTGPMGPLPLHLTEYASLERHRGAKQPFGAFLDLLTDRMLQFFYRSWADSQPAAQADRPDDDRFAGYLSYLSGAGDTVPIDASFPARARIHYAAVFIGRRSAAALQDALSHLLERPVEMAEFIGRHRRVIDADRTRIGVSGAFQGLGAGAVLGSRTRQFDDTFRVIATAETMEDYRSMLPGGRWFKVAREAVRAFAPTHLEWELELKIAERAVEPVRLDGSTQLGWTSWMIRPGATERQRTDARLRSHH